jgi:hypothetical protein
MINIANVLLGPHGTDCRLWCERVFVSQQLVLTLIAPFCVRGKINYTFV